LHFLRGFCGDGDSLETFAKAVNKFFTGTLLGKAEKAESVDNLWITLLEAIPEQTKGKAKGCSMSSVKRFMTVLGLKALLTRKPLENKMFWRM
jgi:hypothetical protein